MVEVVDRRQRNKGASQRWRARNPDVARAVSRRNYVKNKRSPHRDPQFYEFVSKLRRHGLTVDSFHALYEAQNMACGICREELQLTKGGCHIDHCHETGHVRGLLCGHCNVGFGMFREDPVKLRSAAEYSEHHGGARSKG